MAGVEVRWQRDGLWFEGKTAHGAIVLAASSDEEGSGATPVEALLVALGGCTGMDVASILVKMRQPLEEFWLEVNGLTAAEHPKRFTALEVVYHLKGDLDETKVRRAIELSETKYCSVEATLRPAVPITSRYVIES